MQLGELRRDLFGGALDRTLIRHVEANAEGLDTVTRHLRHGRVERCLLDIGQCQVDAGPGQRPTGAEPDAAGRAGDDGVLAFEGTHRA